MSTSVLVYLNNLSLSSKPTLN